MCSVVTRWRLTMIENAGASNASRGSSDARAGSAVMASSA